MKPKLLLASKSPRRRELLARLGIPFETVEPDFEEPAPSGSPKTLVLELAEAKARSAWRAGDYVLGADTVVVLGNAILGKPKSAEENREFLRALSGNTHTVYTAAVLIDPDGGVHRHLATPSVTFRALSDAEIDWYVASGEGLDKAGGYGIQARGMVLVEAVHGDFYAVVGLPVAGVWRLLLQAGFPVMAPPRSPEDGRR